MTANQFRRIALGMSGAVEASHMDHPDFRANGRIFATLDHENVRGMVKLTPEQQRTFIKTAPEVFQPCNGAWGRQGCTNVYLAAVKTSMLRTALDAAATNVASTAKTRKQPDRKLV